MYVPPAFKIDDLSAIHATISAARIAHFVTSTPQGLMASTLPLFLDEAEGPYGTLHGHLARANPQWTAGPIGEAMALFMGPDAYVTPAWYETKKQTGKVVPTWNYVAVEAIGPVEFFDDTERLLAVVTRLTQLHESARAERWAVNDAPPSFIHAQLRGIVGLRMPISKLSGKSKMSQNRTAEDRAGVIAGLSASENAKDRVVAEMMKSQGT